MNGEYFDARFTQYLLGHLPPTQLQGEPHPSFSLDIVTASDLRLIELRTNIILETMVKT